MIQSHPICQALQVPIFDEPLEPDVERELNRAIRRHSIRIVGSDAAHGRSAEQVFKCFVKGYRIQFLVREHLKRCGFSCEPIEEVDSWVDERVNGENFEVKSFSVFNRQPSFSNSQMYQTLLSNAERLDYLIAVRYFSRELLDKLQLDLRPFVQPWFLISTKTLATFFKPSQYANSAAYYQTGLGEKSGNCARLMTTPEGLRPDQVRERLSALKLTESDVPDHEDVI